MRIVVLPYIESGLDISQQVPSKVTWKKVNLDPRRSLRAYFEIVSDNRNVLVAPGVFEP